MQTNTAESSHSTILTELKTRTADQHRSTENSVNLLHEDFSIADYRKLLARFYAFYEPFEKQMRRALRRHPVDLDYSARLNAPKLFADLQILGMSAEEINRIEPCEDLPALDSEEKIFGSLYVVEGSTLGGQVISRHLREKFGFEETSGAAFFSGYGKDTGRRWNEFRAALSRFAEADAADREEIIQAARATFEKIGKSLARAEEV